MQAALSVYGTCNHIKIFATIRLEAARAIKSPNAAKTRSYMCELEYSSSDLLEIFSRNISQMDQRFLAAPKAKDLVERFIGFSSVLHETRIDEDGNPCDENVFDYVYRHTFGRPRDIVFMGHEISRRRVVDPEGLRQVVNSAASFVLQTLKAETMPFLREDEYTAFLDNVETNVLTEEQLDEVNDKSVLASSGEGTEQHSIGLAMYRLGFLGYVTPANRQRR